MFNQESTVERLNAITQLWTELLRANRRNVNTALIQSLRCYLENAYSRAVLLWILVLTYTSWLDNR